MASRPFLFAFRRRIRAFALGAFPFASLREHLRLARGRACDACGVEPARLSVVVAGTKKAARYGAAFSSLNRRAVTVALATARPTGRPQVLKPEGFETHRGRARIGGHDHIERAISIFMISFEPP